MAMLDEAADPFGLYDLSVRPEVLNAETNPASPYWSLLRRRFARDTGEYLENIRNPQFRDAPQVSPYAIPEAPPPEFTPTPWDHGATPDLTLGISNPSGRTPVLPSAPPAADLPPSTSSDAGPLIAPYNPGVESLAGRGMLMGPDPLTAPDYAGRGDARLPLPLPPEDLPAPGPPPGARTPTSGPPAAPPPSWLDSLVPNPNSVPPGWTRQTSAPTPPPGNVPDTSLLGRMGSGSGDFLKRADDWRNDHRLTLLALGAGMAGAQNLGQGLNRGMQLAIPAMQADIGQQHQNQTVAALIKRGVPQDVALAAASNPAIMGQLVANVFGAKQKTFTQIGEDMLGNKRYGFVDPVSGKVWDLSGKEITGEGGTGGAMVPNGPDGQPLRGAELLAHLDKSDPVTAAGVRGMINGDLSAAGRNLQKLAPLASLVDPTFDMGTFRARQALRQAYMGGGKQFNETLALNTVGGHLGRLMESADALDNSSFKPINHLRNWYSDTFTGNPALVRFRNDLVTTQNELAKAYHGGHVSDSAYSAFNNSINAAQTPAELRTAIGELAGLLQSKIEANESGYRSGMAQGAQLPDEYRAINDEARHAFSRINDWARGVPLARPRSPPAGQTAPPAGGALPPDSAFQWHPDTGLTPVTPPQRTSMAEPPLAGARLGFRADGTRGWFTTGPNGRHYEVMAG